MAAVLNFLHGTLAVLFFFLFFFFFHFFPRHDLAPDAKSTNTPNIYPLFSPDKPPIFTQGEVVPVIAPKQAAFNAIW